MSEGKDLVRQEEVMVPTAERQTAKRFTVKEITKGSTVLSLEAALAIQLGKAQPTGYAEASGFFRDHYGETTDAQCVWLIVEAEKTGQLDQAKTDFPEVENRAHKIIKHMKDNNPQDLVNIMERVSRADYDPDQVRRLQAKAARAFEILFPQTQSSEEQ